MSERGSTTFTSGNCGFKYGTIRQASVCLNAWSHFQSKTVNSQFEEETGGLGRQGCAVFHYIPKWRKENRGTLFIIYSLPKSRASCQSSVPQSQFQSSMPLKQVFGFSVGLAFRTGTNSTFPTEQSQCYYFQPGGQFL